MKKWILLRKGGDFEELGRKYNIHPILARILRNREVQGDEIYTYLHGEISDIPKGDLMKDMVKGAEILAEKIREKKKIRILGDYDIDGVMSSYILVKGIEHCGGKADTYIPHRMTDGYGLNENLVQQAFADEVDTIVTCDNGISAMNEIQQAKEEGMTVVVTDHHDIPYDEIDGKCHYKIPMADAVVDPKQEDCPYPFEGICGAVVAWKFIQTLYEVMGFSVKEAEEFLVFAAIATVGDVMDLQKENRIIVKEGLKRIKKTGNPGLDALIKCCGLWNDEISCYHIGFLIGPCINATGRLETAKKALELFLENDKGKAMDLAQELVAINEDRKYMTQKALDKALVQIEESEMKQDTVLVVYLEDCHESLAGIVAGRIKEEYYKPALVITKAKEGLKGSGRSIEAFNMYEELNKCRDIFTRFGGHKMAAGFSMDDGKVEELRKRLNENHTLSEEDLREKLKIDMELPFGFVNESLIQEIGVLEPFGNGNPRPVFALRNVKISKLLTLGKEQQYRKMYLYDEFGGKIEGILFQDVERFMEEIEKKYGKDAVEDVFAGRDNPISLHVAFYPDINTFRGNITLQIKIIDFVI